MAAQASKGKTKNGIAGASDPSGARSACTPTGAYAMAVSVPRHTARCHALAHGTRRGAHCSFGAAEVCCGCHRHGAWRVMGGGA